jgi:pyruvate kinase
MSVEHRRTKIVATIGPATSSPGAIGQLIEAGMDAARLNMSHGTREEHAARARTLRGVEEDCGRPIALIADLQGPKLRVGELPAPLVLERDASVAKTSRRTTTSP